MPGPVFPKKVWRGLTQDELDQWRLKCDRMLDVASGRVYHHHVHANYVVQAIDRMLMAWARRLKEEAGNE